MSPLNKRALLQYAQTGEPDNEGEISSGTYPILRCVCHPGVTQKKTQRCRRATGKYLQHISVQGGGNLAIDDAGAP